MCYSDLLAPMQVPDDLFDKKFPLYLQIHTLPEAAPYLVTANKGPLWITKPSKVVGAAILSGVEPQAYFLTLVKSLVWMGLQQKWGNVHPLDGGVGLQNAVTHVANSCNTDEFEILINPETDWKQVDGDTAKPLSFEGCALVPTPWLPLNWMVVVPTDREFLGLFLEKKGFFLSIIHNPSRAFAVAVGGKEGHKIHASMVE